MHGPIRDQLENLLSPDILRFRPRDLTDHLASCDECSSELDVMRSQSLAISKLRVPEAWEPPANFYARVLQKIEERQPVSFWSIFAESPFTKRLALASLTVVVALGGYMASEEMINPSPFAIAGQSGSGHYDAPVMGSRAEQRDAVLDNFVAHRAAQTQGQLQ